MNTIPIFDLTFDSVFVRKFLGGAKSILESGRVSEHIYCRKFENAFAKLVHARYAVVTSSGTTALEVALRALDVRGKKVILPSNTFFATSIAVINAGAELVFCDIERETLALDPGHLQKLLKETSDVAAVIVVHIGGMISSRIGRIKALCTAYRIFLVEDAAHAHGSTTTDGYAGTLGDIGCFSFFPTKVMTTGEGGMITTNNPELHRRVLSLKNFGRDFVDEHLAVREQGSNAKVSEFTGLFGLLECGRVRGRVRQRNRLLQRYKKNLTSTHYRVLEQQGGTCSYYKCVIVTDLNRDAVCAKLKEAGIETTGEVYRIPLHRQPIYARYRRTPLPATDALCDNHFCPPLYPELSFGDIDSICDVLMRIERKLL